MSMLYEMKTTVVAYAQKMSQDRLVTGTSGNISCINSEQELVAITPTGVNYDTLGVEDITILDLNGVCLNGLAPSSEAPMHLAVYRSRKDVQAIVHTHSMFATTFAVLGQTIPAMHYMVTAFGGDHIPITGEYKLFGTVDLAEAAVAAMGTQFKAVLLRNHGALTVGATLAEAYKHAVVLEEMAELYYHTRLAGNPVVLTNEQVVEVQEAIKGYGRQLHI